MIARSSSSSFYSSDTEAVSYRRIDFQRLKRFVALALGRLCVNGTHVVQAVGKFYYDDPYIVRHCDKHFTDIFRLCTFSRLKRYLTELCDAVHKIGNALPNSDFT